MRCEVLQHLGNIDHRGTFAGFAAGEGEIGLEHALQFIDVAAQRFDFRSFRQEGEFELEAGQDGSHVVRNAGEHSRALFDLPLDAPLHFQKGGSGAADFRCAARAEVCDLATLAEGFGGFRKVLL